MNKDEMEESLKNIDKYAVPLVGNMHIDYALGRRLTIENYLTILNMANTFSVTFKSLAMAAYTTNQIMFDDNHALMLEQINMIEKAIEHWRDFLKDTIEQTKKSMN